MKLAYYIWETYTGGGLMKVTIDKVNYWAEQGHEVWLITREQKRKHPFFPVDSRVKQVDIEIDYQDVNAIANPLKRFRAIRQREREHLNRLQDVLDNARVDIFINTIFAPEADLIPKLRDKSIKVLESHGVKYALFPNPPRSGWRAKFATLVNMYRRAKYDNLPNKYAHFVVLSSSHLEQWREIKNITAISNPCTLQLGQVSSLEEKRVLYLGRIGEEKNVPFLIDVWAQIAKTFPEWDLTIAGSGDQLPLVEERIKQYNLDGSVTLIPHQSDVASLYLSSSVLVLTSKHEGFPMVLLEAQTAGLPCVSLDCPLGPRDILSDGIEGFLIPTEGGVNAFVKRLSSLLADADLRTKMGSAAKKSSHRYTPSHIMLQWEELFKTLLR